MARTPMTRTQQRQDALLQLLALPDPPELRRGYRYTQSRPLHRDPDVIKRDLGTAYVQFVRQQHVTETGAIVSLRRSAKLTVVRPERKRA